MRQPVADSSFDAYGALPPESVYPHALCEDVDVQQQEADSIVFTRKR